MKTKIFLTVSIIIILFVSCTGRRDPVPAIGPGTLDPRYQQLDTSPFNGLCMDSIGQRQPGDKP